MVDSRIVIIDEIFCIDNVLAGDYIISRKSPIISQSEFNIVLGAQRKSHPNTEIYTSIPLIEANDGSIETAIINYLLDVDLNDCFLMVRNNRLDFLYHISSENKTEPAIYHKTSLLKFNELLGSDYERFTQRIEKIKLDYATLLTLPSFSNE